MAIAVATRTQMSRGRQHSEDTTRPEAEVPIRPEAGVRREGMTRPEDEAPRAKGTTHQEAAAPTGGAGSRAPRALGVEEDGLLMG